MTFETLGLKALHRLDPERAHTLSLLALRAGLGPAPGLITSPRLTTSIGGLDLPNPLGLAAGLDKNATAIAPLLRAGFGFVEVGAATPRPQPGNPRPRLFRLTGDQAAINRFGFNNDGMEAITARLKTRPATGIVGLNLSANKDSSDRAADFSAVLAHAGAHIDFATVNVSSPNTERLRDLQGKAALSGLLTGVMETRNALACPIPIFLKIAPDLTEPELADVVEAAIEASLSGLIATNTTLSRDGLTSPHREEKGGLSGQPLFALSTRILARAYLLCEGRLPLIGVGGIGSAQQAYDKIRAGAAALQLYTAISYHGLGLVSQILAGLEALLARDGIANISEATGIDARKFATQP